MKFEDIMLSEISQSQNDKCCMIHLYEKSRVVKFIQTKWNGGCQGLRGREKGEWMYNGYIVSVWEDEKILEIEGGDITQQCKCT